VTVPLNRARRTGPRELSVAVTPRYRLIWWVNRTVLRTLFKVRVSDLPRRRPIGFLTDMLNGQDDIERRRTDARK
jgi:hypothetical protein